MTFETVHGPRVVGTVLRRWPNIDPTMGQCIVFAGLNEPSTPVCFTHGGGERPMQYSSPSRCDPLQMRLLLLWDFFS